jgi:hypothetical protein
VLAGSFSVESSRTGLQQPAPCSPVIISGSAWWPGRRGRPGGSGDRSPGACAAAWSSGHPCGFSPRPGFAEIGELADVESSTPCAQCPRRSHSGRRGAGGSAGCAGRVTGRSRSMYLRPCAQNWVICMQPRARLPPPLDTPESAICLRVSALGAENCSHTVAAGSCASWPPPARADRAVRPLCNSRLRPTSPRRRSQRARRPGWDDSTKAAFSARHGPPGIGSQANAASRHHARLRVTQP